MTEFTQPISFQQFVTLKIVHCSNHFDLSSCSACADIKQIKDAALQQKHGRLKCGALPISAVRAVQTSSLSKCIPAQTKSYFNNLSDLLTRVSPNFLVEIVMSSVSKARQ